MPQKKKKKRLGALILASGEDHFQSRRPKEAHLLLGRPLLSYALEVATHLGAAETVVVCPDRRRQLALEAAGHDAALVRARGSSHGSLLAAGLARLARGVDDVLVLQGDQPLLEAATTRALLDEKRARRAALGLLTTAVMAPPDQLCVERDEDGEVRQLRPCHQVVSRAEDDVLLVVEDERPREVDAGCWICDRTLLADALGSGRRGRSAPELLRALVTAARAGGPVSALAVPALEALAVVSRLDQAAAVQILKNRLNRAHMFAGVTLEEPASTLIEPGVEIGRDTTLGAGVQLRGATRIGAGVSIEPHVIVIDSEVADAARLRAFSHLEGALVREGAIVGPYARLRPAADIGAGAHVGNFVEVKKAVLEAGAKANHLAYLGDARIGSKANIGAGTICCNYDGVAKHHTDIGRGVFIGSNSTLVAPIEIGDGAYVAAGSTLTQEVPADALAFGRARQLNKEGLAARIRKRNRARAGK